MQAAHNVGHVADGADHVLDVVLGPGVVAVANSKKWTVPAEVQSSLEVVDSLVSGGQAAVGEGLEVGPVAGDGGCQPVDAVWSDDGKNLGADALAGAVD